MKAVFTPAGIKQYAIMIDKIDDLSKKIESLNGLSELRRGEAGERLKSLLGYRTLDDIENVELANLAVEAVVNHLSDKRRELAKQLDGIVELPAGLKEAS